MQFFLTFSIFTLAAAGLFWDGKLFRITDVCVPFISLWGGFGLLFAEDAGTWVVGFSGVFITGEAVAVSAESDSIGVVGGLRIELFVLVNLFAELGLELVTCRLLFLLVIIDSIWGISTFSIGTKQRAQESISQGSGSYSLIHFLPFFLNTFITNPCFVSIFFTFITIEEIILLTH